MKKRKSFLLVTLMALIAVFTVVRTATSPYQKIRRYVAQHREPLTAACEALLQQQPVERTGFEPAKLVGVCGEDVKIVRFSFGGSGIAPASISYGFYYSPDDLPIPCDGGRWRLERESAEAWVWQGAGDNGCRARRLGNGWYYVEAWV
ncbi:MAG: hypothetical protein IJF59_05760 [Clostridia bacterium]|nr:hypothetical protein [Clostridia bacterium]